MHIVGLDLPGFLSDLVGKIGEVCCGLMGLIAGVAGMAVFLYLKKKHKKNNETSA